MYISLVYFNRLRDKSGEIVSDARPIKSVRKFTLENAKIFPDYKSIVVRVHETDSGFALKVTRGALGGEVLFDSIVPDGQYTRVNIRHGSFWFSPSLRNRSM